MYVPDAFKNIISISSLTRNGYEFQFTDDVCNIYFRNKYVGLGYMHDGLYYLDNNDKLKMNASNLKECNAMVKINSSSKYIWHLRLGHAA